jgi:hypothetical protein
MSPGWFAAVNVVGTTARVLAIRWAGHAAGEYVAWVWTVAARFRAPLTVATAVLSVATAVPMVVTLDRMRRRGAAAAAACHEGPGSRLDGGIEAFDGGGARGRSKQRSE